MNLIETSVKRPVGVVIIMIAVMILGVVSLQNLQVDLLPDIEFPMIVVNTSYPDAAPDEVEKMVTKPLEGALSTLQGLDQMQSISAPNVSVILLQLDFGLDLNETVQSVRDKIELVKDFLPENAKNPMVLRFDPSAMPIMQLGLAGETSLQRLTDIAEDTIQPQLERITGVGQVSIVGGQTREIQVVVDPNKLASYGLTMPQLAQLIAAENLSISAGTLQRGTQETYLRVKGELERLQDLANVVVPLADGTVLKLSDLATVKDGYVDQESFALVNGHPAVTMEVLKTSDGNTVDVAADVMKELDRLKERLPEGVELQVIMDSSQFINDSLDNIKSNMLVGGGLAILILYLFLGHFRSTFVIATAIPIALISAFTLVYFSGQTLNIITMGGLALGIGMMVDSSIVILENIYSYRERKYPPLEAATLGAREVAGAVVASTLTSIMVFAPIVFTSGISSQIFTPMAAMVTFTLVASLMVALTLVPMLAGRWITEKKEVKRWAILHRSFSASFERLKAAYTRMLRWSIHHRKSVIIGSILLLLGSFLLVPLISMEFLPSFDQGELTVSIQLPTGSRIEETTAVTQEVSDYITSQPGVDVVYITVGKNQVGTRVVGYMSEIYVRMVPKEQRDLSTNQLIHRINQYAEQIPGAEIRASNMNAVSMGGDPIAIEIYGDDPNVLEAISEEIKARIALIPGTTNIDSTFGQGRPEVQVIIDREKAAQYGLTYNQVMSAINQTFQGVKSTTIKIDGQEVDVKLLHPEEERQDIQNLRNMTIHTPTGGQVPLVSLAEVQQVEGPAAINRKNQERGLNVTAEPLGRGLSDVMVDIRKQLDSMQLPEGYHLEFGGQNEEMVKAFTDLTLALILAIFLVYAVMAVQFESALYPFIIMFSLPATFIGVLFGLAVTGRPLSVPAFIGVIMLMGIVVNNAIVLVDYINTLRRRGIAREAAILEAGPQRFRPILMTTLTTILAMLPLTLGIGDGAEMQAPLATVVVFGLLFSTLITLILVPVVYISMDKLAIRFRKLFRRDADPFATEEDAKGAM